MSHCLSDAKCFGQEGQEIIRNCILAPCHEQILPVLSKAGMRGAPTEQRGRQITGCIAPQLSPRSEGTAALGTLGQPLFTPQQHTAHKAALLSTASVPGPAGSAQPELSCHTATSHTAAPQPSGAFLIVCVKRPASLGRSSGKKKSEQPLCQTSIRTAAPIPSAFFEKTTICSGHHLRQMPPSQRTVTALKPPKSD